MSVRGCNEGGILMCFIDAADNCDMPCFHRTKIIRARKGHECIECGESIRSGDQYENYVGCFDGEFFNGKTCMTCVEVRNAFFYSWTFGHVWDDLMQVDISLSDVDKLSPKVVTKISDQLTKYGVYGW